MIRRSGDFGNAGGVRIRLSAEERFACNLMYSSAVRLRQTNSRRFVAMISIAALVVSLAALIPSAAPVSHPTWSPALVAQPAAAATPDVDLFSSVLLPSGLPRETPIAVHVVDVDDEDLSSASYRSVRSSRAPPTL